MYVLCLGIKCLNLLRCVLPCAPPNGVGVFVAAVRHDLHCERIPFPDVSASRAIVLDIVVLSAAGRAVVSSRRQIDRNWCARRASRCRGRLHLLVLSPSPSFHWGYHLPLAGGRFSIATVRLPKFGLHR